MNLKRFLNENNKIGDLNTGKYINHFGKLGYVKKDGDKTIFIHIGDYELLDFYIINNGVESNRYEFIFKGATIKGTYEEVLEEIVPNYINGKRGIAKDFISDIIAKNSHKIKREINGGYGTLDDIKEVELKPNDLTNIQKRVVDYMVQEFTPEMLGAFRLLILMPFHWILKNDPVVNKKSFIKGLSNYGWRDRGKTFIVNFVLNMFRNEIIDFIGEEGYKTLAGFYGGLKENMGIFLVDDCNKILNENQEALTDIINGIPRKTLIRQGTEGGKAPTNDPFYATPVFTSNNQPNFNQANLLRVDVIYFSNLFKPRKEDKFNLKIGKKLLLKLGALISMSFKNNYEAIIECDEPLEASNIILNGIDGLDFTDIINTDFEIVENLDDTPINIKVRNDIENRIGDLLNYNNLEDYTYKFNWILKYDRNKGVFYTQLKKFYNYLEQVTSDTSRDFEEAVKNLPMKSTTTRVNGKAIRTYAISERDFYNWLDINIPDEL